MLCPVFGGTVRRNDGQQGDKHQQPVTDLAQAMAPMPAAMRSSTNGSVSTPQTRAKRDPWRPLRLDLIGTGRLEAARCLVG